MATAATTTTPAPHEARRARAWAPWWVWLLGLSLGAVHLLPHLGARLVESPPERVYVGFVHMIPDQVSYLGFAEQVRRSPRWPLRNPYTTEPQDGRFVMLFFWLVGVLAWLTGTSVLHAWYALTPLCSMLMALAVWRLCGLFLTGAAWQRVGFLITCLGGGLGWLGTALSPRLAALEVVRFDWNWSVLGAAMVPMWTLAHALLALVADLLLPADVQVDRASLARAALRPTTIALLLLLSYLIHPYTGLAGLAIGCALALSAPRRPPSSWLGCRLPSLLAVALGAALIAAVAVWARGDGVYRVTSERIFSWTEHYSPLWYPLMYGMPLLLAVVGAVQGLRTGGDRRLPPLLAWCATTLLLSNLWFVPGVKFQYLAALPLSLLATRGLRVVVERAPARWTRRTRQAAALLLALAIAGGPLPGALQATVPEPGARVFVSQPQLDLLAALRALPTGGVVAPPSVAILVPWQAAKPVYDGHWFLSPQHEVRLDEVRRFFHPETPEAWKLQFIERARVRYLIEDPWSTGRLGQRLGPLALVERFRNPFGRVLELVPPGSQAGVAP